MPKRKYSENADHNEVINKLYADIRRLKEQNKQLILALGEQKLDITWDQLIADVKRKNHTVATILNKAYVRRFEQGKIYLAFRGLNANYFFVAKYELANFLKLYSATRWGYPFTIKINFQD